MTSATTKPQKSDARTRGRGDAATSSELFQQVRAQTMNIVAPLEIEDYVVQTAEFMSPPRWHIGHTSWFFETLLRTYQPGYQVYNEAYLYYFNSYYEGFGERIDKGQRGTRSRPTVRETVRYRQHVDEMMMRFLTGIETRADAAMILALVRLGLEHEMQHQELLVYDIKHLLGDLYAAPQQAAPNVTEKVSGMVEIAMMGKLPYTVLQDAIFAHPTLAESLNKLLNV